MTDNNSTPIRYKQAKRKPLRMLVTVACSAIPLALLALITFLLPSENEAGEVVKGDPIPVIILIAFAVIASVISYFVALAVYKSDGFCITDDGISYDFTFVIKKNLKLPFDKINNVKIKRSIFERMLGLSTVSLNSGSGIAAGQSEIALTFNKDYAEYFADYIQKRSAAAKKCNAFDAPFVPPSDAKTTAPEIRQNTDTYTVSKADKFRSIFSNGLVYLGMIVLPIFFFIIFYFDPEFTFDPEVPEFLGTVVFSLIVSAIALVLILIGMIIYTFIRYYDYKIYEQDGVLHISYGFINKHSVSVGKDKIRGYSMGQGLLRQMLGIASLRLIVVGINDMSNNSQPVITYLYPCGKLKKLQEVIDKFLPEFKFEGTLTKAGKHAFLHNYIIPLSWTVLLFLPLIAILSITLSPLALLAIPTLLLLPLLNKLLLKKNSFFGLNKNFLYSSSGGIYKSTHIIRADSVQEIRSFQGFIRRKQNIASYRITYRGDNGIIGNRYYIRNLPKINLDEFK